MHLTLSLADHHCFAINGFGKGRVFLFHFTHYIANVLTALGGTGSSSLLPVSIWSERQKFNGVPFGKMLFRRAGNLVLPSTKPEITVDFTSTKELKNERHEYNN